MTPAPKQGPDELMIHWGTAPLGTAATLYLPGVSAAEIMRLADRLYTRNRLKAVGENSIQLDVTGGVSYIPVPTGGADLAGLLTLDLPETVRKGQVFRVIVDQVIDSPPARPRRGAVDATGRAQRTFCHCWVEQWERPAIAGHGGDHRQTSRCETYRRNVPVLRAGADS